MGGGGVTGGYFTVSRGNITSMLTNMKLTVLLGYRVPPVNISFNNINKEQSLGGRVPVRTFSYGGTDLLNHRFDFVGHGAYYSAELCWFTRNN